MEITEKRFTENVSTQKVIDNQTGKEYNCLIDDDLLKLLNELHEENIILKRNFDSCAHNWGLMYDEAKNKVEELSEENQLLEREKECYKLKWQNQLKATNRYFEKYGDGE